MNKNLPLFSILAVVVFFAIAYGALVVRAESLPQPVSSGLNIPQMVGKSLGDTTVTDFMAANHCTSANQYQLCESTGIALMVDSAQTVKTVILFPGRTNGFAGFRGELPLRLTWQDTLGSVNQKLGVSPDVTFLQEADLPNESGTPDNIRLWAEYKDQGLTIIYNTLSAESNSATIHAVLLTR